VSTIEWIAWTPMLIGILVLGIYPDILFGITDDSVTLLTRLIGR
jgi:NADH-quinone oxidoreductase subunit M